MSGPSRARMQGWASDAFADYLGVLLWPAPRRKVAGIGRQPADGDATMVVSLRYYGKILCAYWRPLALSGAIGVLLAIVYLHMAAYRYTVSLVVAPVQQGGSTAMTNLAGLAGLAGVALPANSGQTQLQLYLAALKSTDVAARLVRDPSISHVVFQDGWDAKAQRWRGPSTGVMSDIKDAIKALLGYPPASWHPPGTQEMLDLLTSEIDVSSAPLSPIVTISYDNKDPAFAERFVLALHKAADDHLRALTVARTTKYNEYLLRQLQTVTSNDQRQAIILSLSNNETMLTSASANVSYSVDVFGQPTASAAPTKPRPPVVLFAALVLGVIAGSILVIWRCA